MTISLRGHHLLCILTYAGRGYSSDFVESYNRIFPRVRDEDVLIVDGPDDICAPLLREQDPHCLNARVIGRDSRALEAVGTIVGRPVRVGDRLRLDTPYLENVRGAFDRGTARSACVGCEWAPFCTTIAADGFISTFLKTVSNL